MAIIAIIAGLLLLVVAVIYFMNGANSLPSFFPGYDATMTKPHIKHGIGVLILGVACFAFAWFRTGKKSAK